MRTESKNPLVEYALPNTVHIK